MAALIVCAPAMAAEVTLKKASLADVEKAIAAHKGKVVVVDVWGDFCVPCKKKFPSVVKLAKDYGNAGLVVISLTLDDADDKEATDSALAFLKDKGATFENYQLADTDDNRKAYEKKIPHGLPPILNVYDREGKLVKTFEGGGGKPEALAEHAKEVEEFVKGVLKK